MSVLDKKLANVVEGRITVRGGEIQCLTKGKRKKMIILQPALLTTSPASPSLLFLSVFPYQRFLQLPFFGTVGEGRTRQMLHAHGVGFLLTVR